MPIPTPLRILHLASSERWTGAAEPLTALAVEQQRLGHRVWIGCVPGGTFESEARRRGVETIGKLHLNRRPRLDQFFSDVRFIPQFCREHDVDVVHCHLPHDHWIASLSLGRSRRLPDGRPILIRTNHAGVAPRNDWAHRRLFVKYTDRLVCISNDAARRAEKAFDLPEGSVPFVRGAIDSERFHPGVDGSAFRRELDIPPDAPVAGIVSRVRAGRGIRWLMRAAPLVLEALPEARIVVVGRGELKKWFRSEIEKPIYRGRVLNGLFRGDDLPEAYAAFDVSLFLGLGSEGTCRAILEAGASGKPTVATRAGATPEIIEHEKTGLLVRDRDIEGLAQSMIDMLGDLERCRRMGALARQRVVECFNESTRTEAFLKIYAETIAEKAASRERGNK